MKKRKFLSLFAILFVAIFAMSVCFFAACKGGSNDDENGDEEGTTQTDPNPNTGTDEDDDGSDNDNENETGRSGSSLTGDEDIIGNWSGDVEVEASAYGFGGTIEAEMTVEITATEFSLSFTPDTITVDDSLGALGSLVDSALAAAGIEVGKEFSMFANEPVYADEEGYYADINGDWVKCQLPLEINTSGQLCVSFSEPLDFSGLAVDIVFDAKLDRVVLVALPEDQCVVKVPSSDDASYLVFDETNAFENRADLSIVSYDGLYYTVNGTSSTMTEEIAEWFGGDGYAEEGDQYVVIKIAVAEGETITYGHDTSKSYTNGGDTDDNFYNGYYFIVYKLTFDDNGVCTSEATYTVTDVNGIETEYTVSFSGVTILEGVVTLDEEEITISLGSGEYTLEASAKMSDGSNYTGGYTWSSSDSTIASVSQGILKYRGKVTPVAEGVAYVTVTLDDAATASCKVNVVPAPTVTSVTISPGTEIIKLGETAEIAADIEMSDGSEYSGNYTWTSSDANVATVVAVKEGILSQTATNRATVTAVAEGTATITLTLDDGQSATCTVIVVDPLVSAYEGDITLGDASASFANENALTVVVAMGEDGTYDYAVTGVATMMTTEQITAYNSFYTGDTAASGDAYIVFEIKAEAGSVISYNGAQITVGTGETSVAIVQKVSTSDTERVRSVTVTTNGVAKTFTVTFTGTVVPDDAIVGTWTAETINASANVTVVISLGTYEATASVEMVVKDDGTFTVSITNIEALGMDFSQYLEDGGITLSGTWVGGEGVYTMTGSEGNVVTVLMTDYETVTMSFVYTYGNSTFSIDITVGDAVLTLEAIGNAG